MAGIPVLGINGKREIRLDFAATEKTQACVHSDYQTAPVNFIEAGACLVQAWARGGKKHRNILLCQNSLQAGDPGEVPNGLKVQGEVFNPALAETFFCSLVYVCPLVPFRDLVLCLGVPFLVQAAERAVPYHKGRNAGHAFKEREG